MGCKGQIPWNKGRTQVYRPESLVRITTAQRLRRQREGSFGTDDAVQLYQQGKSMKEVALILHGSETAIWRRLSPLGVLKDRGWKRRGQKLSPEIRLNMSRGIKKSFESEERREKTRGKNNPFFGRRHKPETIACMKLKLSQLLSGENNPQWRGGLSYEPYGKEFNKRLKEWIHKRDGYKCQACHRSDRVLVVHHIDYDKRNNEPSNLVSLCRPCHGKTVADRGDWRRLIQPEGVMAQ